MMIDAREVIGLRWAVVVCCWGKGAGYPNRINTNPISQNKNGAY